MSLLSNLASGLIFGPPAPISKDSPPRSCSSETHHGAAHQIQSDMRVLGRRKATKSVLTDKTNETPTAIVQVEKSTQLPTEPQPQQNDTDTATLGITSTFLSSGASVLSVLGSLLSSAGPGVALTESTAADDITPTPSKITVRLDEQPSSILDSVTEIVVDQAVSICSVAVASVKQTAMNCTDTLIHAITDTVPGPSASASDIVRPPSPTPSVSSFSSTVSYIPPQYTSTGELFSSNPSVAAMQRIPDYSCGHDLHAANKGLHCCTLPSVASISSRSASVDSTTSSPSCASPEALSRASSFASIECTCDCFKSQSIPIGSLSPPPPRKEASALDPPSSVSSCECVCHDHHRYRRGQSGHFHRISQIARSTKRVVRDIKNAI